MNNTFYIVPMFPYPSGRLHMGHARNYAIADAYARHQRMMGKKVLFPIGWDAFGLPAEKAAIEHGADPRAWTDSNIDDMREQLKVLDLSFDWEAEIFTHRPEYYAHTQKIFTDLMRAGYVRQKQGDVHWDPVDETVLANEQVVDGKGWRSGAPVTTRSMTMYYVDTPSKARELHNEPLDWTPRAKAEHLAWIQWDELEGSSRLHEWCVSRQRKWGTPVPAIECTSCGAQPVPDALLPVRHEHMGAATSCPACKGSANYSAQTLDTFFDSAWYFLHYPQVAAGQTHTPVGDAFKEYGRVNLYIGGREHATMHLLYARFMTRVLHEIGYPVPQEPFEKYMAQGMVNAPAYYKTNAQGVRVWVRASEVEHSANGPMHEGVAVKCAPNEKMSKSKLNGVDPLDICAKFGVDTVRLYMYFSAPFDHDVPWDDKAMIGCKRFLEKVERAAVVAKEHRQAGEDRGMVQYTPQDAAWMRNQWRHYDKADGLHTVVAACMKLFNGMKGEKDMGSSTQWDMLIRTLYPLVPSFAQRMASVIGVDVHTLPKGLEETVRVEMPSLG